MYYGRDAHLEYDFVIQPGGNPGVIRLAFEGGDNLSRDSRGDLVLQAGAEKVRFLKPNVYQQLSAGRVEVEGEYALLDHTHVGFNLGQYDVTRPLVIDPVVLGYSSYLGGSGTDAGLGIALDSAGAIYVTGQTSSLDFPTASSLQPTLAGSSDVFVSKLNPSGSALLYSTYLGGTGSDRAFGVVVDPSGAAYVTGDTNSTNFPTVSALQAVLGGLNDAFVAKLSSSGSALMYATYLGGSETERGAGVGIDNSGNAYVAGYTQSSDFPTANAFQAGFGGGADAFMSKLNAAGSGLVYSTYLGGSASDLGQGMSVDSSGIAYLTGFTDSANFPILNALQNSLAGLQDAFVTKFGSAGSILYSTYLGGSDVDTGRNIALDSMDTVYVIGATYSADFPIVAPFQGQYGGERDAFVSRLSASGSALLYSTYLGGNSLESGSSIAVDGAGNIYVSGNTMSRDFPVMDPLELPFRSWVETDMYVSKLNPVGSALIFSTRFGGRSADFAGGLAVDPVGNAYVTGQTTSIDLPTVNSLQANIAGEADVFIAKLSDPAITPPALTSIRPRFGTAGTTVNIRLNDMNFMTGTTSVDAGTGISVGPVTVVDSTSLTTNFMIAASAIPGARSVTVTTPTGTSNAVTFNVRPLSFFPERN